MRSLLIAALFVCQAAPAAAQLVPESHPAGDWVVQRQLDRQHDIALQNQLTVLESQIRTDQAIADLQARSRPLTLPAARQPGAGTAAVPQGFAALPPAYASIPDDKLAASNARAKAAAENRH